MMKFFQATLLFCTLGMGAASATGKGQARVDWIAVSGSCAPGKPIQTAVRMIIDPGWHTYWVNPGEAGMKCSFDWKLPDGWTAGEIGSPVPKRFSTGDIPGFGYEGTVLFPVVLTAPADFTGSVTLSGTVSWLACNDGACVPGESEVSLQLSAGPASPGPEATLIEAAVAKVPTAQDANFKLAVMEDGKFLRLHIEPHPDKALALPHRHALPATPDVIDASAEILFTADGAAWTAKVPKSEYAPEIVGELMLVLCGPEGVSPISLKWQKSH